jgi:hypothetical protein
MKDHILYLVGQLGPGGKETLNAYREAGWRGL